MFPRLVWTPRPASTPDPFADTRDTRTEDHINLDEQQLIERCGRLPLAIRVLAARLRDRTIDIAQLRAEFEHTHALAVVDKHGESRISPAIELAYRHLEPGTRRVFCLLGLHPHHTAPSRS